MNLEQRCVPVVVEPNRGGLDDREFAGQRAEPLEAA
jgi:hypothetical protein